VSAGFGGLFVGVRSGGRWRRSVRLAAAGLSGVLVGSLLWAPPRAAAAPGAPGLVVPPGRSVPVTPIPAREPVQAQTDTAPAWDPGLPVWPAGGTATVAVDTGAVGAARAAARSAQAGFGRVGGLPLVARNRGDAPADARAELRGETLAGPGSVRVSVAGRDVTDLAGVRGVLFTVTRADGRPGGSRVALDVDYSQFRNAYGGNYGGRLRLVRLPACVLTTPGRPECQVQTPVEGSVNVPEASMVSIDAADVADGSGAVSFPAPSLPGGADTVPARRVTPGSGAVAAHDMTSVRSIDGEAAGGGQTVYALTAAAASNAGDYSATSLTSAYGWAAGTQGGEFTYSLPLQVPPSLGGPAPELTLGYSSGSVDGRTTSTNSQTSWVGEGWDLQFGYIERGFRSCADDGSPSHGGDLCYFSDGPATMVFGGRSVRLIKDDTTGVWKGETDDGSRIERLVDGSLDNGGVDAGQTGVYWKVTTTDGTQYFFGRNKRYSGDPSATNSTLRVPVFSNHSWEPCYNANQRYSMCNQYQIYRWNLDYVVDPRGNSMTYSYQRYTAKYGAYNGLDARFYDLTGAPDHIDYGTRAGSEGAGSAPMRVDLVRGLRCVDACTVYPDTPWDLECDPAAASCPQTSPTFFTPWRLASVQTKVWNPSASGYRMVDQYDLTPLFPDPTDGSQPALWFNYFLHTGKAGTADVAMPQMHFGGTGLRNRVAGVPATRYRISSIATGSGGQTTVEYSPTQCTAADVPNLAAVVSNNTMRCFPQWDASVNGWSWFHKYLATAVVDTDLTGGSPAERTEYTYSLNWSTSGALWASDRNETAPDSRRTWSDFVGYTNVTISHGPPGGARTVTHRLFFRGMHGDPLPSGNRSSSILDDAGATLVDHQPFRGFLREEETFDGSGNPIVKHLYLPTLNGNVPTATRSGYWLWGHARAFPVLQERAETATWIAATNTWRWTRTDTSYNTSQLPVTVTDYGDTGPDHNNPTNTSDDTCTSTTYATPDTTKWMIDYPAQTVTTDCAASPSGANFLAGSQTQYDGGAVGATPTQGLATRSNTLAAVSGTTLSWAQAVRAEYDTYGRVTGAYDALDRRTGTVYTPAAGGPVTGTTVTNPAGHVTTTTLDGARGLPVSVVDANTKTTTLQYDALGRLTKVFKPRAGGPATSYTATTSATPFVDIADGTAVDLDGDDNHTQVSLPFTFPFYGQSYTSAWLSTNGLLSFTDDAADSGSTAIPDASLPNAAVYAFWDDLVVDSSSQVWSKTTGTAPNRKFTIEWQQVLLYNTSKRVTFSITLAETTGTITLNYTDLNMADPAEHGGQSTVGVEDSTGSTATQFSLNQPLLANNQAITFTPNNTPTTALPDLEYTYTLRNNGPNSVSTKRLNGFGNHVESFQLYDGRLRPRQSQVPSPAVEGGRIISDVAYDGRGLAVQQTSFWNSAAPTGAQLAGFTNSAVDLQLRASYDTLGRQTSFAQWSQNVLKWQTVTGYGGDRVTVTPPDGGATVTMVDALGRTTDLHVYPTSAITGTPETTHYTYDRLGRLATVTDPAGNLTSNGYDLLGRRTSVTDPDTGTSTYSFNLAGELLYSIDGRNQKLSNERNDSLGRVTATWAGEVGTGTKLTAFVYDTKAKGQLTSSTRYVGGDAYTVTIDGYTERYQPTGRTWSIPIGQGSLAGSYQNTYSYDLAGNLVSATFPAGGGLAAETVTYGYNPLGYPTTLSGTDSTGSHPYVTGTGYTSLGQLGQRSYGDPGPGQLTRSYTWDPATGRLANITSKLPNPAQPGQHLTVQNDIYSYTPTGDISAIKDGTDNQSQCYQYDGQHRLTEAWTTLATCATAPTAAGVAASGKHPYWDSYSYDTAGRRSTDTHRTASTATTRVVTYPAGGTRPAHAATSVQYTGAVARTDTMTYDNAGNTSTRTIDGVSTDFTFNSENRFAGATVHAPGGNQTTSHLYGADGELPVRHHPLRGRAGIQTRWRHRHRHPLLRPRRHGGRCAHQRRSVLAGQRPPGQRQPHRQRHHRRRTTPLVHPVRRQPRHQRHLAHRPRLPQQTNQHLHRTTQRRRPRIRPQPRHLHQPRPARRLQHASQLQRLRLRVQQPHHVQRPERPQPRLRRCHRLLQRHRTRDRGCL
jgi:YD repeat-containing protein